MRHSYATAMLMAGMTPAFCAKQLGHSVEVFLNTYAKWLDGDQDALEMARLEATFQTRPAILGAMAHKSGT
jgi:integrase